MKIPLVPVFLVLAQSLMASATGASPVKPVPPRTLSDDLQRRIDVNRVNMFVTNFGSFGFDIAGGNAGLYYPRGASTTALFAGGLWLSASFPPPRVAIAEYSQEYAPGRAFPGGTPEPDAPDLIVYKMKAWTGNPADSAHIERTPAELAADPTLDPIIHHSWSEYMAGAATRGAPVRAYKFPDLGTPTPDDSIEIQGPDVSGDQMLWSVYNDLDLSRHTAAPGRTLPVGVEVRCTVFGFDRSGPLGDAVFIRYQIRNGRVDGIDGLIAGVWTDPDLGGFTDDMIGSDIPRSMGYVYNADGDDTVYGTTPPALGVRLLDGAMTSCVAFINGTDPQDAIQSTHYLQGLLPDGSPFINPLTATETPFMFTGDPVTGNGWLDSNAADKRMLLARKAYSLAPDSTYEVLVAIVLGRGDSHLSSISELRCNADFAAESYGSGFTLLDPGPETPPCPEPLACPRPLLFWQDQCLGVYMPPGNLQGIAQDADAQSAYFQWNSEARHMCETIQLPYGDWKSEAERQFASLLANVSASKLGIKDVYGKDILLSPVTSVSCPGIPGNTVADLIRTGSRAPSLQSVRYQNANPTNATALVGVDLGLPHFGGGASVAYEFLGSSLDPAVWPDSFATVDIRFSTVPQKAYRYLRLERASDGAAPPQGRGWLYGGFHDVPFQVWDIDRNVQLEVAFVERTLTDDFGTILPDFMQPATFNSTWGPDASDLGGREYLIVFRNAYSGSPDPFFEMDNMLLGDNFPGLYAMWPKLLFDGAIIDPGDFIRFLWAQPVVQSVDQRMIDLETWPPGPDLDAEYMAIASCLEDINSHCDVPTPVLASLVQATATPDAVDLAWYAPGLESGTLFRSERGVWGSIAEITRDGRGMITWTDRNVIAGERYGYRLVSGGKVYGETWMDVPTAHRLSLAGAQPNPSAGDARIALTLKRRAPAKLEVMDVQGRRVAQKDLGDLGPGSHIVRVPELKRLPAGIYLLRLTQDRDVAIARMVRVN